MARFWLGRSRRHAVSDRRSATGRLRLIGIDIDYQSRIGCRPLSQGCNLRLERPRLAREGDTGHAPDQRTETLRGVPFRPPDDARRSCGPCRSDPAVLHAHGPRDRESDLLDRREREWDRNRPERPDGLRVPADIHWNADGGTDAGRFPAPTCGTVHRPEFQCYQLGHEPDVVSQWGRFRSPACQHLRRRLWLAAVQPLLHPAQSRRLVGATRHAPARSGTRRTSHRSVPGRGILVQ